MQPETHKPRESKLAKLCEMIAVSNEVESAMDKLVALSMKAGYELGKQTK